MLWSTGSSVLLRPRGFHSAGIWSGYPRSGLEPGKNSDGSREIVDDERKLPRNVDSRGVELSACDNALAESVFASLECEMIDRRSFKGKTEARLALFTWIEAWYNPRRRHSALGRISPIHFERIHATQTITPAHHIEPGLPTASTGVTGATPAVDNPTQPSLEA